MPSLLENLLAGGVGGDLSKEAQIRMMLAQSGTGGASAPPYAAAPFAGLPTMPKATMFDPNYLANFQQKVMPAPEPAFQQPTEPIRPAQIKTGESLTSESFDKALQQMAGKKSDAGKSNLDRITDALKASYNAMSALYGQGSPATMQKPSDGVSVSPDPSLEQYRYNLGNIRTSNIDWQGKTTPFKGFESFSSPELGARAMYKNLSSYANSTPSMTLAGAISKWAPRSENDTDAYIKFVAEKAGIDKETLLSDVLKDPQTAAAMMYWMGTMEHGQNLPKVFTPEFLAKVAASANG